MEGTTSWESWSLCCWRYSITLFFFPPLFLFSVFGGKLSFCYIFSHKNPKLQTISPTKPNQLTNPFSFLPFFFIWLIGITETTFYFNSLLDISLVPIGLSLCDWDNKFLVVTQNQCHNSLTIRVFVCGDKLSLTFNSKKTCSISSKTKKKTNRR